MDAGGQGGRTWRADGTSIIRFVRAAARYKSRVQTAPQFMANPGALSPKLQPEAGGINCEPRVNRVLRTETGGEEAWNAP